MTRSSRSIPIPLLLLVWLLFIIFNAGGARADWWLFLTVTLIYVAWKIVKLLIRSRRQEKERNHPSYQPPPPVPEEYQQGAQPSYEQQLRSAPQYQPPSSVDQPPL
jgi:hypothetical protein